MNKIWLENNLWNAVKSTSQLTHALQHHTSLFDGVPLIACNLDLGYNPLTSNASFCPVDGVTNKERNKSLTLGYHGFSGTAFFSFLVYDNKTINTDDFIETMKSYRIHLSSGGLTQETPKKQSFCFMYSIFLDDWPALRDEYMKIKFMSELSGEYKNTLNELNEFYPASSYAPV